MTINKRTLLKAACCFGCLIATLAIVWRAFALNAHERVIVAEIERFGFAVRYLGESLIHGSTWHIDVGDCGIDNSRIQPLSALRGLRTLNIRGNFAVTDDGVAPLFRTRTGLEELYASETNVLGMLFARTGENSNLKVLTLGSMTSQRPFPKGISSLKVIERIELRNTVLDSVDVEELLKCARLKCLQLYGCELPPGMDGALSKHRFRRTAEFEGPNEVIFVRP